MKKIALIFVLFFSNILYAQDISVYQQFNGRVDFLMIGNTLNLRENEGADNQCFILTNSSASLNLNANDQIEAAYLYWAGSGTGDFNVTLNNTNLIAQRTFSTFWYSFEFFSAFYDVTQQVSSTGNGTYTLSNLDLNSVIQPYCQYGINFGGWAMIIVYSNPNLPINQINVYDGMQSVIPDSVTIQLNNLNVIDNTGAQIGFLAWEGDSALAVSESLTFNGNVLENLPLNPSNNAFNSTNSFTGATDLYNMDLDVYDIENYINVGDTSATINLTSGQDFVMINAVVSKLNSQLPDASIQLNDYEITDCNNKQFNVDFTIYNLPPATKELPTNTPISFYAYNGTISYLIGTYYLPQNLAVGEAISLSYQFVNLPSQIPTNFQLIAMVDDDGNGHSTIIEINENNNDDRMEIVFPEIPTINTPQNLVSCNIGYGTGIFNIQQVINDIENNTNFDFSFYTSLTDLYNDENEIIDTTTFESEYNNQPIYIKATDLLTQCYTHTTFYLLTKNCPPKIPQLLPTNTTLDIDTLYNIYLDFELIIYNRYGNEVFRGNNNTPKWNGTYKNKKLPSGTYFYIIYLNDGYFETMNGWIYLL